MGLKRIMRITGAEKWPKKDVLKATHMSGGVNLL